MSSRKTGKAKRGRGRPAYEPTDKERGAVQALSAAGYNQDEIADYVGIDPKTLRDRFPRELDFATMELIGAAVGKIAKAVQKGEAWAICFVLKTRGKKLGWTERHELTGADGAPLDIVVRGGLPRMPVEGETFDQLIRRKESEERAQAESAAQG